MSADLSERTRLSLLAKLRDAADPAGWNAAWERFYRQYGPMMLAWCLRRGLQPADAEEVSSAVLFALSRRMEGFDYDPSGRFRGWLKTVVQNEVNGFFARQARKPGDCGAGATADDPLAPVADHRAAADQLAEELADRRELLARGMEEARGRVEARTWEAFRRTAVADEPAADVARDLGMSLVAVYKAKSRVLELIREAVDRLRPGG